MMLRNDPLSLISKLMNLFVANFLLLGTFLFFCSAHAADPEAVPSFDSLKIRLNILFGSDWDITNRTYIKIDDATAAGLASLNSQVKANPEIAHIDLFYKLVKSGALRVEIFSSKEISPSLVELARFTQAILDLVDHSNRRLSEYARRVLEEAPGFKSFGSRAETVAQKILENSGSAADSSEASLAAGSSLRLRTQFLIELYRNFRANPSAGSLQRIFENFPSSESEILSLVRPSNRNTKAELRHLRELFKELIRLIHSENGDLKRVAKAQLEILSQNISKKRRFEWIMNFNHIWELTLPMNAGLCRILF